MNPLDRLRERFAYEDWANRQVLAALRAMDPVSERSRRWLAHIVGTQETWLSRLQQDGLNSETWPDMDLDTVEAALEGVRGAWGMYFDGLTGADLDRAVAYTNTKGDPWSSRVCDILDHVLLHGAYHRGQIAADIRAEGGEPAATDYIFAVREGRLEAP